MPKNVPEPVPEPVPVPVLQILDRWKKHVFAE